MYTWHDISVLDVLRLHKDDKRLEDLFPSVPKRMEQIRKEMEESCDTANAAKRPA